MNSLRVRVRVEQRNGEFPKARLRGNSRFGERLGYAWI